MRNRWSRLRPALIGLVALGEPLLCHVPSLDARTATAAQTAPVPTDGAVRDTLQRYSAALERLDPEAVKKVQPAIPVATLAKAFKDMRELKVVINDVRVLSTDGSTARVSCRVTQTLTPKAGSKQTTSVTRVMRLRRDSDIWVIDAFER